ncbi:MAG: hypothetical protein ISR75_03295 [Phycisphaerales bacterium]|nr:hypothetical protein [Phycisphaerales bacterium]
MKIKLNTSVLVFFVLLFSITHEIQAQSIPLITDPIKVREVELMSNKLDMTNPQREAILEVYDRYLDDFARTRAGEIKDFEDAIAESAETFAFMRLSIPERALIEELVRKAQRAMKAIHRSDNLFFEEVSGMLTENQRKILGRVRIARELEAYDDFATKLLGELNRGTRAQMRKMCNRLDAETNVEMEGALDLYDQRYLNEVKEGFDAVIETVRLALDQIDELGVRGLSQQELMMRFMADETAIEDLKRRGDILLKPLVEQAYEISQLNWKTWKKIDAILDEGDSRKLQSMYFSKSFSDAVRGVGKITGYLDRALMLKELSEGQRVDLEALQSSFNSKWAKITKNHAEVLEKSRKIQTIAIMSGEVTTEFDEKLSKLNSERREYVATTESRIDGILGKQLTAKLKKSDKTSNPWELGSYSGHAIGNEHDGSVQIGVSVGTPVSQEELDAMEETESVQVIVDGDEEETEGEVLQSLTMIDGSTILFGGATIPKSIAPSFPHRASSILGLDANGTMIIDAVYEDYREKYNLVYKTISVESKKINDDQGLSQGVRMRKIRDASITAAQAVADLDLVFFDDLAVITDLQREDLNLKMLENHRQRQRSSAPEDPFGWRGGEGDTIDLVGLYVMSNVSDELHEGLSENSVKAIRKAMQGYHEQVATVHEAFLQAMYDMSHLRDATWLMDESNQNGRGAESIQDLWRETFTAVRDSKRALMLVNQTVMDSLLEEVPEGDFWKVRMEFVKKAYPDVFKKGADVTTMLTAANAISTLDAPQKSKLETLESMYRYEYWELCESMIESHKADASSDGGEGFMNKEDMHRQLRLETLRFERRELNDRIRMRLRMVLHENQIKEVPGLRPSVASANYWD